MKSQQTVGFVGVGRMGGRMVSQLIAVAESTEGHEAGVTIR